MRNDEHRALDRFEAGQAYWREQLSGELNEIRLPEDFPVMNQYTGAVHTLRFSEETVGKLMGQCRGSDLLLFVELLAAFKLLLFKYSGEGDIWVASPVYQPNNRQYNNYIILRDRLSNQMRFVELLARVKQTVMDGYMNEFVPLARIRSELDSGNGVSFVRNIFSCDNLHDSGWVRSIAASGENDVAVNINRSDGKIGIVVTYNAGLFRPETVRQLFDGYLYMVDQVLTRPQGTLDQVEWLIPPVKERLLLHYNATARDYPARTLHHWFEEQAAGRSDEVAVRSTIELKNIYDQLKEEQVDIEMTFGQLNSRANQLARELLGKGVRTDTLVGLLVRHPLELVVAILGILKSGGAYLPVDPDYPEGMKTFIIGDSGISLLVTETKWLKSNTPLSVPVTWVVLDDPGLGKHDSRNLDIFNRDSALAYGIYTSGTTGNPKGMLIEHRGVVNYTSWRVETYGYSEEDVTLQLLSYCFDGFGSNFYSSLLSGGCLFIVPEAKRLDFDYIRMVIREKGVTNFSLVPGMFRMILDGAGDGDLESLRFVVLAGEKSSRQLVADSRRKAPRLGMINEYGPTETTVTAACHTDMNDQTTAVIGAPIANTRIYIVDSLGHLLPLYVPGEIAIAGAGVGRGYLNNPELTAARFTPNHFSSGISTDRLFRSGDRGRWLEGGVIEFDRRLDQQVKIRGYRIELAHIENCLLKFEGLEAAVVTAREEESGQGYLCAYISPPGIEAGAIRSWLARQLPQFMIPDLFIPLERIPLTANGKVDRRALPEPGRTGSARSYIEPRDETEKRLAAIWTEVLKLNRRATESISSAASTASPGIDDNFFDLGGHSLRVTMLVTRIKKVCNLDIQMADIFKYPTIRQQARLLRGPEPVQIEMVETIRPVEKREYYPLSSSQRRLFILHQMLKGSIVYNIPGLYMLEAPLDRSGMAAAFDELVRRHESFRTYFVMAAGEPVQRIQARLEFEVECLQPETAAGKDRSITRTQSVEALFKAFVRPFDLSRAPLLRVGLVNVREGGDFLFIDMHHIVTDGFSRNIMVDEYLSLYNGMELPPLKLTYKDYAAWQRERRAKGAIKNQARFWLDLFKGDIPLLDLPVDFARPEMQDFTGRRTGFSLGEEETAFLKGLTKISGRDTTLFMVLLAVFKAFISRLTGQRDIVAGTVVAGRRHADLEGLIGMFVNTLALRNEVSPFSPFIHFVGELKQRCLDAFENQEFPFEELVEILDIPRDAGRNPLFDVMFTFQDSDTPKGEDREQGSRSSGSRDIPPRQAELNISKFDLSFDGFESDGCLHFSVEYSTCLFREETIRRFGEIFKQITASLKENPRARIGELEIMSPPEKREILYQYNRTGSDYPRERSIPDLFEDQVTAFPGHIALVGPSLQLCLSYRELARRSGPVTRALQARGVGADTIVGLLVDRSVEMIIAILGILNAAGAYLPIEPDSPAGRIEYMLADSAVHILLTNRSGEGKKLNGREEASISPGVEVVDMSRLPVAEDKQQPPTPQLPPLPLLSAVSLAYVIYTSGTTGRPKGTLTVHRNVVRVVRNTNYIEIDCNDRLLQLSNYAFDGSVFDIFGALLNGAALVMLKRAELLTLNRLAGVIKKGAVTLFFMTTALFNTLADYELKCLSAVRRILIGGERISVEHARKALLRLGKDRLVNVYGPTETTVYATYFPVDFIDDGDTTLPIGTPLANTTVYILDRNSELLPKGITGEIYIGGDGTARGYLNQPEQSAEKFKADRRFSRTTEILYRTGDLGKWQAGGDIAFLGRIDYQVKIRGFRIEPAEIETQLSLHESVKEAAVAVNRDAAGQPELVAYVVLSNESDEAAAQGMLKEFLSRRLPAYMVPRRVMGLEKFPLTVNGKLDRRKLPLPDTSPAAAAAAVPVGRIERQLQEIWAAVLGRDRHSINVDSNFFELGGHSLKATLLVSKIHQAFDVNLQISDVFATPDFRGMAGLIQTADRDLFKGIRPVERRDYYPLSSAQKRLYILQQMRPEGTAYNIPFVLPLGPGIMPGRIENIFKKLIERHESLRTSFIMLDGHPVQQIHRQVEFRIKRFDVTSPDRSSTAEVGAEGNRTHPNRPVDDFIEMFIKPFDLCRVPLWRVGFIRVHDGRDILMIDMHHIVTDGFSQGILVREFQALYRGERLSPAKLSYKDYARWQIRTLGSEWVENQQRYWSTVFWGDIPVLNLPTDYPRSRRQSFEGDILEFDLNREETAALKATALELDVTLFMLLLALFNVLLSKLSGQEDIVTGIPVAGRRHSDLSDIIGMFVNTLALRNEPRRQQSSRRFIRDVRQRTLEGYENQDYPFEDLIEGIRINRDAARNPLFDVMFALQNLGGTEADPGNELSNPHEFRNRVSKFDLTFNGFEVGERLLFKVNYCTGLFKEESVARWIGYFKRLVSLIPDTLDLKLAAVDILPDGERREILYHFNETEVPFPDRQTVLHLWTRRTEAGPDRIAVGASRAPGNIFITRRELFDRSLRLAACLRDRGLTADDIAALKVERSPARIIALLGVLLSGAAYLPISPDWPEERSRFMMTDSGAHLLLTAEDIEEVERHFSPCDRHGFNTTCELPWSYPSSVSLAYVIYTSGSTGRPKGVLVEHHSVTNVVCWFIREHRLDEGAGVLQLTDYTFDASVNQIFGSLCSGAVLYVPHKELVGREAEFRCYIDHHRVTHINFVPTVLGELLIPGSLLQSLQAVIVGGERLDVRTRDQLADRGYRVINQYGPTETTIDALAADCSRGDITLGKPIANMRCYIMNSDDNPAPIGVVGEIYIGGEGVTRGYLNNPELTAQQFIGRQKLSGWESPPPERFISRGNRILYKTGDLGRWRPDGTVEFMGRRDHQVKIRGHRIELAEIENLLTSHQGITKAVVTLREHGGGESVLCAYVVPVEDYSSGGSPADSTREWKAYLSRRLPDFMVPTRIEILEKIPLTATGKIDRRSLPAPQSLTAKKDATPANHIEKQLIDICKKLLNLEYIGLQDDFFAVGGNSIRAIRLVAEIYRIFEIEIPTVKIFQHPRIADIADRVARHRFLEAEDELAAVFNSRGESTLFCFPPALSYGISYYQLSLLMPDYTFFAFNYVQADDRIDRYVRWIVDNRSHSASVLLGYSAGGKLCLKVADVLEHRGCPVSDIILIDSYLEEGRLAADEMDAYLEKFILELDDNLRSFGLAFMKARVVENCRRYAQYLNTLEIRQPVEARLHLIRAEDSRETLETSGWMNLARKEVLMYNGAGCHKDMLQTGYIEKNAVILREILGKIGTSRGG